MTDLKKNKVKKHLSIELKKEIIKLADENLDKTGSRFISLKIGRNIAQSSLREILDKKQEILSSSNNKNFKDLLTRYLLRKLVKKSVSRYF